MENPFLIPHRTLADGRPLDPLEHAAHHDYYVDVDGLEEAFGLSKSILSSAVDGSADTRLIVLVGGSGTGKTSVALRLLAWFKESQVGDHQHQVVNLSKERFPPGRKDRQRTQVARVLDRLGLVIAQDRLAALRSATHLPSTLTALADILVSQGRRVAIFLPPLESLSELELFDSAHANSLYFLSETTDPAMLARNGDTTWTPESRYFGVGVGPLRAEDGLTFVRSRLSQKPGVEVDEEAVKKMMESRVTGQRGQITIRELQNTMSRTADKVIARGQCLVEYSDITDHYLEAFKADD